MARSLLKQLLTPLDAITPELELMYSKNTKPNVATCQALLHSCSQKFDTIYAVFDAVDECNDEILEFIAQLPNSYRILLSSRPHLIQNLRSQLTNAVIMNIAAEESDLQNYIVRRLVEKGNRDHNLQNKCLDLAKDADGMFVSYHRGALTVGFYLPSSS